jgi:Na+-translocating ferredoxin:NAD+ oxidoreductase RnfG subunit
MKIHKKNVEYTTHNIEKKSDNNLKKEGIVEVHNYTELQNAVNNASSKGVDTTIRLLQGSYNNTGTIRWIRVVWSLQLMVMDKQ